jgi:hypothetical protein
MLPTPPNYSGSSGNRVGSWKDVRGSQENPLLCKEGGGEVEILLAHMNHGSPREAQPLDVSTPPGLPLQRGGTAKAQTSGGMGVPFLALLCNEGGGEVEKGRKLHGAHTKA